MSDLVKRLREGAQFYHAPKTWNEAADRIADLERQLAELRQLTAQQVEDAARLDWLDAVNRQTNERHNTTYGWKFDINHNRAALTDHNLPALSIREAIDVARQAGKEKEKA